MSRKTLERATNVLFLDTEFTGLHQDTTLISLALVTQDGRYFYAESTEYDEDQVDEWVERHVLPHLTFDPLVSGRERIPWFEGVLVCGTESDIVLHLKRWLLETFGAAEEGSVEVWGDVLAYDWVLFCELFGGTMHIPDELHDIPFDLAALMKARGVDPDVNRFEYAGEEGRGANHQHHALWDAMAVRACYNKLMGGSRDTTD